MKLWGQINTFHVTWFGLNSQKLKGINMRQKKPTLFNSVADLILANNYRYFSWSHEEILGIAFVSQDEMVWCVTVIGSKESLKE